MIKASTKIKCVNCFKSLGIPSRIEIYSYLRNKNEASVSELVKVVNLSQPTVSYHLKEMRELGLLSQRKSGKEVYYRINPNCRSHESECVLNLLKFSEVTN
jgi:ArsR family transcriptional regulator, arsenate/arsenite/antimonite-responsive transcriptional repressor